MTSAAPLEHEAADAAPVSDLAPALVLARVRRARCAREAADRDVLVLAVEWAHSHPVLDVDGLPGRAWMVGQRHSTSPEAVLSEVDPELSEAIAAVDIAAVGQAVAEETVDELGGWYGIPPVAWDAPAGFAAANGMSTYSGKCLIRDALVLCHRLPRLWAGVVAGQVLAWRARKIAERVLGLPADVCAAIDAALAPVADRAGPVTLDRLITETLQRLHAEARELDQVGTREERHVTLDEPAAPAGGVDETGNANLSVCGDFHDLHAFERMVARIAELLKRQGNTESLGIRRATAVGVLSDPHQAAALLDGTEPPTPSKQVVLYLHLSEAALGGHDTVGRCETLARPVLAEQIREWCSRSDTYLTVRPVIDLADHHQVDAYETPDRLRDQVILLHGRCVFPWCRKSARRADCDHITPHGAGGPTCSCNLAPLCRHHHQLKTHTGWRYIRIDATTYRWTDPHGLTYVRDRAGTRPLDHP